MRRSAMGLVAALALVLAACSGANPDPADRAQSATPDSSPAPTAAASAEFVSSAAASASEFTSGRFSLAMVFDGAAGQGELLRADVAFDAAGRSEMTVDMSGLSGVLLAESGQSDDPLFAAMEPMITAMFADPWSFIVDGSDTYVRMPVFARLFGAGDGWVRTTAETGMDDLSAVVTRKDMDDLVQMLEGAGEVDDVGVEDVRGVQTTKYVVVLDPEAVAANFEDDELEHLLQLTDGAEQVEVWIDEAGVLRRLRIAASTASLEEMVDDIGADPFGDGTLTLTLELFDLGDDITIVLPDPAEVTDENDLGF